VCNHTQVAVLQNANKNMKQQFKQIDIDSVEDLYDEMSEIIDQSNQVQEALRCVPAAKRAPSLVDRCPPTDYSF